MLRIQLAPTPPGSWREPRQPDLSQRAQTFIRSPIQGGYGELIVYDIVTRELYVTVPIRRFDREYSFQPAPAQTDASHAILQFRRQA